MCELGIQIPRTISPCTKDKVRSSDKLSKFILAQLTRQEHEEQEEEEFHPKTAEEDAMIKATLARISGLRLLMVGVSVMAGVVALVVYLYEYVIFSLAGNPNTLFLSLSYSIFSAIPFMGVIGFASFRANKHIRRLSRGRYMPPQEEDY
jgi:hypothetical protein